MAPAELRETPADGRAQRSFGITMKSTLAHRAVRISAPVFWGSSMLSRIRIKNGSVRVSICLNNAETDWTGKDDTLAAMPW